MSALAEKLRKMVPRPAPNRIGPIGLHLADEELHATQFVRLSDGRPALRCWHSIAYERPLEVLMEDPLGLKRIVRKLLTKGKFKGRRVVTAMPPENVRISSLTYPAVARGTEGATIAKLMAERLDGPLSDYVIDYIPIRAASESDPRQALVATCRQDAVINYLESLKAAGLAVDALEIGPTAIRRLVSAMQSEESEDNVLVINFGKISSYLTLISRRRLMLDQQMDFGEQALIQRVSESLDLAPDLARSLVLREGVAPTLGSPTDSETGDMDLNPVVEIVKPEFDRLAKEIKRANRYGAAHNRGGKLNRVYMVGSVARWPEADAMLSKLTGMVVTSMPRLLSIFQESEDSNITGHEELGPEFAVAIGLALKGVRDNE